MLALAVTAGVTSTATPAAAWNHRCWYMVTDTTYVRENPTLNSVVRKTKYYSEVVIGYCDYYVWGTDGRYWKQVECGCATDGEGWIIHHKLAYGGVVN